MALCKLQYHLAKNLVYVYCEARLTWTGLRACMFPPHLINYGSVRSTYLNLPKPTFFGE